MELQGQFELGLAKARPILGKAKFQRAPVGDSEALDAFLAFGERQVHAFIAAAKRQTGQNLQRVQYQSLGISRATGFNM